MFHTVYTAKSLSEPFPDTDSVKHKVPDVLPLSPDPGAPRHKVYSADKVVRELLLTALQLPKISSHPWEVCVYRASNKLRLMPAAITKEGKSPCTIGLWSHKVSSN